MDESSKLNSVENDFIKIQVSRHGAELHSLFGKQRNREYIWQGDKTYWKWHAPICFPITGRVHDDKYSFDGKNYALTVHGFARDYDFSLVEKTENKLIYELKYNTQSLCIYPFKFRLKMIYSLLTDGVKVEYIVENLDDKDMFFELGLHTAYNCPMASDENFSDYELIFEAAETADRYFLENGIITGKKELLLDGENILDINMDLFAKDLVLFKNLKSKYIILKSKTSNNSIKVSFNNFANLGLWTKPQGAPFVCIEPWNGLPDIKDKYVDFSEKEGINKLSPQEKFICSYQIQIIQ